MAKPKTAVLLSAGLDSAVLAAAECREYDVHPVYVSTGLAWEAEELAALARLMQAPAFARVHLPVQLTVSVEDVYPASHWALRGQAPGFHTPDSDVYLTGRNVLLLCKAAIFCTQKRIERIAMAPLAGNPFPDATPEFFTSMARALSLGLAQPLDVATPFAHLHKADVIALGVELGVPLEWTLSCMQPAGGLHCGVCSKCRERRDGFLAAQVPDKTEYATAPAR